MGIRAYLEHTVLPELLPVHRVLLEHTVRLPDLLHVHRVLLERTVLLTELLLVHRVLLEKNLILLGQAVVSCRHI